ncbi:hypothetical protein SO802_023950 [Lithocarpus litseifolius]|uniref:Uncharacterized protein n=1 Tax=Lithocarpus litseifolius TaxID=425828 RepID=A0AAW2CA85_9ROSI
MMSRLFRSNSTNSLASRSTSLPEIPQETEIINSEGYEFSDVDLKLGEWNLPKIQNPDQDSKLDFVQQLADGSVRLSFDKSRFRSPLDDYRPRSRRDLGPEFQGVKTRSQVSTPCYTAKQDSVVDQEDDNSQKVESPSGIDMEDPYQDYDLKVLRKAFEPDMDALGKEFDLEKNRVKREPYRANHTREQKVEVLNCWKEFLKEQTRRITPRTQIEDPVTKAQKLSEFRATLVKETSKPEPKIREPKVDLDKIYDRFSRSKKEVTVNDLQKEIKETKSEVRTLKQEMTILRVDNSLLDKKVKNLEETSHQENEKDPPSQNTSDEEDETVNPTADMVQDEQPITDIIHNKQPSGEKFLQTMNRINF